MESATKYQDSVYFAADRRQLPVRQPLHPLHPDLGRAGVTVTQTTDYPREQGSTLVIGGGGASFELRLRVPSWATAGFRVTVNGRAVPGTPTPGSYFTVSRAWRRGDTVRVRVPFRLRVEKALDDPSLQALFYGPVNLVGRDPNTDHLECGLYGNAGLSGDLLPTLTPVSERTAPLHAGRHRVGAVRRGGPRIRRTPTSGARNRVVLGGTDSGARQPGEGRRHHAAGRDLGGGSVPRQGRVGGARAVHGGRVVEAGLLGGDEGERVVRTARRASYAD